MQRHHRNNYKQQATEEELAEEAELDRQWNEMRIGSRTNRGLVDVDAQSTLSDGLLWMEDSVDLSTDAQRYADYLDDGGTEPIDRYILDYDPEKDRDLEKSL